jgi:hypothetical protein
VLFTRIRTGHILGFPLLPEELQSYVKPSNWSAVRRSLGCTGGPCEPSPMVGRSMKAKRHLATALCVSDTTREREAQEEIDTFLQALSSYPDRFAREPYLSFRQHLSSIVTAAHPPSTDHDRRHSG